MVQEEEMLDDIAHDIEALDTASGELSGKKEAHEREKQEIENLKEQKKVENKLRKELISFLKG